MKKNSNLLSKSKVTKKVAKQLFPIDDDLSILQGDGGDCNLDMFYSAQFVQNETCDEHLTEDGEATEYYVEQSPILAGTLVGILYVGTFAIATFIARESGELCFTLIGHPKIKPVNGQLCDVTGAIIINWSDVPDKSRAVVSYEYNMDRHRDLVDDVKGECRRQASFDDCGEAKCGYKDQSVVWDTIHGTQITSPTFNTFLTHEQIMDIVDAAHTRLYWDFNTALGDTIKEKYETLYCKANELANVLVAKGAAGIPWIAASPEVCSIFEVSTAGFCPAAWGYDGIMPMGVKMVQFVGCVNSKFRLYKDFSIPCEKLVVGFNDRMEELNRYGVMTVANFII